MGWVGLCYAASQGFLARHLIKYKNETANLYLISAVNNECVYICLKAFRGRSHSAAVVLHCRAEFRSSWRYGHVLHSGCIYHNGW